MFFEGESLYVSKSIIRIFLRSFGLCCVYDRQKPHVEPAPIKQPSPFLTQGCSCDLTCPCGAFRLWGSNYQHCSLPLSSTHGHPWLPENGPASSSGRKQHLLSVSAFSMRLKSQDFDLTLVQQIFLNKHLLSMCIVCVRE